MNSEHACRAVEPKSCPIMKLVSNWMPAALLEIIVDLWCAIKYSVEQILAHIARTIPGSLFSSNGA